MPEPLQLVDNEEVEAVIALRAMLFPAPKVFPRRTTGTAASTCLCRLCQRRAGRALKGPAGPLLEPRSPLKAEARPRVSLRASAPAGEVSGHVLSQMQPAGLQTTCSMHQGLSQSRGSWLMVREVQGVEASCSLLQACGLRPMVGKVYRAPRSRPLAAPFKHGAAARGARWAPVVERERESERASERASVCVEASCGLLQARRRGSWLAAGTGEREREREHDSQHDSQHDSHVCQASPA